MRFIDSKTCTSGLHCASACRKKVEGRTFRRHLRVRNKYTVPEAQPGMDRDDWECPPERGAKPWEFKPVPLTISARPKPIRQDRPRPSFKAAATAARTILTQQRVSQAVSEERAAICAACPLARQDDQGLWCSVCGCGVSADARRILNLAAYEERVKVTQSGKTVVISGCKHPQRGKPIDPARPDGRKFGWPQQMQISIAPPAPGGTSRSSSTG